MSLIIGQVYRNITKGKRCDVVGAPDDGVLILPCHGLIEPQFDFIFTGIRVRNAKDIRRGELIIVQLDHLLGKGAEGLTWSKTSRALYLSEDIFPNARYVL